MTLKEELEKIHLFNRVANFVMNTIGSKDWFQSVSKRIEPDRTYCLVVLNRKVDPSLLRSIPEEIEDVKIRIFYGPVGLKDNFDTSLFI